LVRSLELNAAVRYTDYSTTGGATTWKVGAVWRPADDFTLRLTRSQDIRAPSLFDLYQPETLSLSGFTDTHTGGQSGNTQVDRKGNPNLVPEVAQTLTVGGVYEPRWLPGLSLSIDYFKIQLNDAISAVNGNATYDTICDQSNNTSPYCALFVRPLPFSNTTTANYAIKVYGGPQNVALIETDGLDLEAGYKFDLASLWDRLGGRLNLRFLASYQPNFWYQASAVVPKYQQAGTANALLSGSPTSTGEPVWKTNLMGAYTYGHFDVNVQYRWRSAMKTDFNPLDVWVNPTIPARAYTDLTVTYNFEMDKHSASIFLAVQNLFNVQPVTFSTVSGFLIGLNNPIYGGDDAIGRYVTVGFKLRI
jgi:outer membrane receptor protein involved in Fe transport